MIQYLSPYSNFTLPSRSFKCFSRNKKTSLMLRLTVDFIREIFHSPQNIFLKLSVVINHLFSRLIFYFCQSSSFSFSLSSFSLLSTLPPRLLFLLLLFFRRFYSISTSSFLKGQTGMIFLTSQSTFGARNVNILRINRLLQYS